MQHLAQKYRSEGMRLFIFGSYARGEQRPNSDLDLDVEWLTETNRKAFLRLYQDVQNLPAIRKIELVDFSQASSDFKKVAENHKLYLLLNQPSPTP